MVMAKMMTTKRNRKRKRMSSSNPKWNRSPPRIRNTVRIKTGPVISRIIRRSTPTPTPKELEPEPTLTAIRNRPTATISTITPITISSIIQHIRCEAVTAKENGPPDPNRASWTTLRMTAQSTMMTVMMMMMLMVTVSEQEKLEEESED